MIDDFKPPKKYSKSVKEQSGWNCADIIDAERRKILNALPKSFVEQRKKLSKFKKELKRLELSLIGHPITPANESLISQYQNFIAKHIFEDELKIIREVYAQLPSVALVNQKCVPKRIIMIDDFKPPKKYSKSVKEQSGWNCADIIDAERRKILNALPKSFVEQRKKLSKFKKELKRLELSLIGHPITPANESLISQYQNFIVKHPFEDELEIFRKVYDQLPPAALASQKHDRRLKRSTLPKVKLIPDSYYTPSFNEKPTQDPSPPPPLIIFCQLNSSAQPPTEQSLNSFSLEGDYWRISFNGETKIIKHTLGMRYIKYLIQNKGKEIHVSELFQHGNPPPACVTNTALSALGARQLEAEGFPIYELGGTGPLMDETGKKALKSHIKKLDQQIEDAIEFGDIDKAEELKNEKEQILTPLSTDFGLGGKPRKIDSPVEKVRKRVEKRISTDIKKLGKSFPQLSKHLACINTGTQCKYDPYPDISWKLD